MLQTVYTALRDYLVYRKEVIPSIIAKYMINPNRQEVLDILLYNDSTCCAYDVEYEFDANQQNWKDKDIFLEDAFRTPIPFLRQGEEFRIPFITGLSAFQKPILEPFELVITYFSKGRHKGKRYTSRCLLDVQVFKGYPVNIR